MNKREQRLLKDVHRYWKKHGKVVLQFGLTRENKEPPIGPGSSTYRAYGNFVKESKPGTLMKGWVRKEFAKKRELAKHCRKYDSFHARACDSLVKYWNSRKKGGQKLKTYPYAAKLVDLQVKVCVWHKWNMSLEERRRLLNSAFQPLDRQSLALLRDLGKKDRNGDEIHEKAKMGSVKSKMDYDHYQCKIREVCKEAKIPLFAFDYFAWHVRWSDSKA